MSAATNTGPSAKWPPAGVVVWLAVPVIVARADGSGHAVLAAALATGAITLRLASIATRTPLLVNDRGRWSLSNFQLLS